MLRRGYGSHHIVSRRIIKNVIICAEIRREDFVMATGHAFLLLETTATIFMAGVLRTMQLQSSGV
jgi:hypothetical protein